MGILEGLAVGVFLFIAFWVCLTLMAVDIWTLCTRKNR